MEMDRREKCRRIALQVLDDISAGEQSDLEEATRELLRIKWRVAAKEKGRLDKRTIAANEGPEGDRMLRLLMGD